MSPLRHFRMFFTSKEEMASRQADKVTSAKSALSLLNVEVDVWENEGGPIAPLPSPPPDELQRYGIVPVQLTVFDWGGYRYSNLKDAIAAAKRSTGPVGSRNSMPIVAGHQSHANN